MKKIAIFVEGETEYDFIKRLLEQIIGTRKINIIVNKMLGGNKNSGIPRSISTVEQHYNEDADFQASIFISGNHENVLSDIRDQKDRLNNQGFMQIIGLRDIRGDQNGQKLTHKNLPDIERVHRLIERICHPIPTKIITAVMEIEAWFLAETNHYVCIDDRLSKEFVISKASDLGFNPFVDDLTLRLEPTEDLKSIYALVKKMYSKKESVRRKTINCLDYCNLKNVVSTKIESIRLLFDSFDTFLN